ncbi:MULTISPECIES: ATP-binding cassette domain-containing protein [Flavobacterium]|uniref:ATP-binding cassette domain-containing protein n=1 Tax=Flavobacterium TaxID=237 RepID=UPI0015B1D6C3|nr:MULTISPECIES: ABC transporter ATP-binding protein [Flavobacterium]
MKYCLEADSIIKSYDDKPILSDIYLKCETNDIIGILGRNGTGKSTLLQILFGTLEAENKFIRINNQVYNEPYKENDLVAFLPQNHFIPNYFSVAKAIRLFVPAEKQKDFYDDSLINAIKNQQIRELSAGELRYLDVRLVLFSKAKFVLLDEPYSSISPMLIEDINNLIITESKEKGIIITDHHYESLLKIATKLYLLKDRQTYLIQDKQQLVAMGYLNRNML